ncbi:MAG: ABC transporter ATP-binding protein [Agarilytica sp.]
MLTAVSIRNGKKSYKLGCTYIDALKGVDLDVLKGDFLALVGPSGSGKSTLLNICGLLDTLDSGEYELAGEQVHKLDPRQQAIFRRNKIGFVFQHFNLFPVMTAFENVEYPLILNGVGKKQRKISVEQALESVGLENFSKHMPDKLSGGERQRVAIARALVKKPALIIADEPTASLDTDTANQVIDLMKNLVAHASATFVIATHDVRMTSRCERILQLVDGEIYSEEEVYREVV